MKFILFADDTTLLASNKSLSVLMSIINKELVVISEWLKANKLSLNIAKTNYIIFRQKNEIASNVNFIQINNITINKVPSTKFLGVQINSEFNWKDHINTITKKVSRAIGVIGRIKYRLTKRTLMLLYDTLVLSQLTYCNVVWASTYKTSLSKLYILQKKALRLCSSTSVKNVMLGQNKISIFQTNNKLSIFDLNKYQTVKFIYFVINKQSPSCFWSLFSLTSMIHSHSTRSEEKNLLFLRQAKTNIRKFSISVQGPIIWNSIPAAIREINSEVLINKSLKKYLLEQAL